MKHVDCPRCGNHFEVENDKIEVSCGSCSHRYVPSTPVAPDHSTPVRVPKGGKGSHAPAGKPESSSNTRRVITGPTTLDALGSQDPGGRR